MLIDEKIDLVGSPRPMTGSVAGASARTVRPESGDGARDYRLRRDDSFLLEGVTRFLVSGLRSVDACLVFASAARRQAIAGRLESLGPDVLPPHWQRQYFAFDADEVLAGLLVDGRVDDARFKDIVGGVVAQIASAGLRVRVFEEMVTRLWTDGNHRAATSLEHRWDDLARAWHLGFFCSYPITHFALEANGPRLTPVAAIDRDFTTVETGRRRPSGSRLRALINCRPSGRAMEVRG